VPISNHTGRLIAAEVLRLTPPWFQADPRLDYLDHPVRLYEWGSTAKEYQARVRLGLQHSQLALLIPGGLDLLPDIYAALPDPYRRFEWELRPRNNIQLAHHLLEYLDWYIDPHQPLPWTAQLFTLRRRLPAIAGAGNLLAMATLVLSPLLVVFLLPLLLAWALAVPEDELKVGAGLRGLIHAAELYFYLSDAYADPPENATVPALT
jgi:hypothetical protein